MIKNSSSLKKEEIIEYDIIEKSLSPELNHILDDQEPVILLKPSVIEILEKCDIFF